MSKAKEIDTSKLVSDLKVVITDTEELLKLTANQAGDKVGDVRNRLSERLDVAKGRLGEVEEDLLARGKYVAKATDEYVHDNPWRAIGAAAGVSFLLGLLIGRR